MTNYGVKQRVGGDHRTNVILMYYFKDQLSQNVQIKEILEERNVVFLMYLEKKKTDEWIYLASMNTRNFFIHIPLRSSDGNHSVTLNRWRYRKRVLSHDAKLTFRN